MKLRDILPAAPIDRIEVRTNRPDGGDMLFGFCAWDGKNLISLDGDSYYLDEEVTNYDLEIHPDSIGLTYWIKSVWESE